MEKRKKSLVYQFREIKASGDVAKGQEKKTGQSVRNHKINFRQSTHGKNKQKASIPDSHSRRLFLQLPGQCQKKECQKPLAILLTTSLFHRNHFLKNKQKAHKK